MAQKNSTGVTLARSRGQRIKKLESGTRYGSGFGSSRCRSRCDGNRSSTGDGHIWTKDYVCTTNFRGRGEAQRIPMPRQIILIKSKRLACFAGPREVSPKPRHRRHKSSKTSVRRGQTAAKAGETTDTERCLKKRRRTNNTLDRAVPVCKIEGVTSPAEHSWNKTVSAHQARSHKPRS